MSPRLSSAAAVADDLYELTRYAATKGYDTAHGFLGGEWGYGAHIDNDVFEMHPFWWGDCECGHEEAAMAWEDANSHAEDCYHEELMRREDASVDAEVTKVAPKLAEEWGLPYFGCAVHCTCGRHERYAAWSREHDHDPACPTVRPNFRHKPSGLEVRWYKYIGRDMELSFAPNGRQWADIYDECIAEIEATS